MWNSLTQEVILAEIVDSFKKHLDVFPRKQNIQGYENCYRIKMTHTYPGPVQGVGRRGGCPGRDHLLEEGGRSRGHTTDRFDLWLQRSPPTSSSCLTQFFIFALGTG